MILMSVRDYAEWTTAIIGGILSIAAFHRWLWPIVVRAFKRTKAMFLAFEKLPTAFVEFGSMKDRIEEVAEMAIQVRKAVLPNGGSSLPDAMARIEASTAERTVMLQEMNKAIIGIVNLQKAAQNTNRRMAALEFDLNGRLIEVSKTYGRWTGVESNDLLGWGWINTVHPEDKDRVRRDLLSAVNECRSEVLRFSMIDHTGIAREVELTFNPVPDAPGTCEKFFGSLVKIEDDEA
jgi:PAS domain S-box-containing protein